MSRLVGAFFLVLSLTACTQPAPVIQTQIVTQKETVIVEVTREIVITATPVPPTPTDIPIPTEVKTTPIVVWPTATPDTSSCSSDRDCADFGTQYAAQQAWEACGGPSITTFGASIAIETELYVRHYRKKQLEGVDMTTNKKRSSIQTLNEAHPTEQLGMEDIINAIKNAEQVQDGGGDAYSNNVQYMIAGGEFIMDFYFMAPGRNNERKLRAKHLRRIVLPVGMLKDWINGMTNSVLNFEKASGVSLPHSELSNDFELFDVWKAV